MRVRFPDMICIGAQKAATTWLDEMLRYRPEFYVPALKELHYFTQVHRPELAYPRNHRASGAGKIKTFFTANPHYAKAKEMIAAAELIGRSEVDDDWYGSIFAQALPGQVCVETCPSYLHLPQSGVEHLLRLSPSVRLLLFVRDPVDRAWSHIRMNLAQGLISDEDALLSGKWITQYINNSEYRDAMTLWRKFSAPGQLNVVVYDEVASDPASVLSRVYKIAGLVPPADLGAVNREVHKGKEIDFPRALRAKLVEKLAPQYEFLSGEFPDFVSKWMAKHRAALA